MSALVIAEHNNTTLNIATLNAVAAASKLGTVDILVAGHQCQAVASAAAQVSGVGKVLVADAPHYAHSLAENLAPLVVELAQHYSHLLAAATTNGKADTSLVYLDTKTLFERLYGLGRSLTPFAQGNKAVEENIDLEKLPAVDSIARHLTPVVWSQRSVADGIVCESTGPLTLNQLVVSGLAVGGYAAVTYQQAVKPKEEEPAPSAPSAPSATPSPRPRGLPGTDSVPADKTPARSGLPGTDPTPPAEKPPTQPKSGR